MNNNQMQNPYAERSSAKGKMILGIVFCAVAFFFFILEIACLFIDMALISIFLFLIGFPLMCVGVPFMIIGIIGTIKANRVINIAMQQQYRAQPQYQQTQ